MCVYVCAYDVHRSALTSRDRIKRDKEVHRLGLRAVEDLPRDVLVDLMQVGHTHTHARAGAHARTHTHTTGFDTGNIHTHTYIYIYTRAHMRARLSMCIHTKTRICALTHLPTLAPQLKR